jgi:hypothetical protein
LSHNKTTAQTTEKKEIKEKGEEQKEGVAIAPHNGEGALFIFEEIEEKVPSHLLPESHWEFLPESKHQALPPDGAPDPFSFLDGLIPSGTMIHPDTLSHEAWLAYEDARIKDQNWEFFKAEADMKAAKAALLAKEIAHSKAVAKQKAIAKNIQKKKAKELATMIEAKNPVKIPAGITPEEEDKLWGGIGSSPAPSPEPSAKKPKKPALPKKPPQEFSPAPCASAIAKELQSKAASSLAPDGCSVSMWGRTFSAASQKPKAEDVFLAFHALDVSLFSHLAIAKPKMSNLERGTCMSLINSWGEDTMPVLFSIMHSWTHLAGYLQKNHKISLGSLPSFKMLYFNRYEILKFWKGGHCPDAAAAEQEQEQEEAPVWTEEDEKLLLSLLFYGKTFSLRYRDVYHKKLEILGPEAVKDHAKPTCGY